MTTVRWPRERAPLADLPGPRRGDSGRVSDHLLRAQVMSPLARRAWLSGSPVAALLIAGDSGHFGQRPEASPGLEA